MANPTQRDGLIQSAGSSLYAEALMWRIAPLFSESRLPLMPLKGVLLQKTIYAQTVRPVTDIDLLVLPKDMSRALACLRRLGYHARFRDNRSLTLRHASPTTPAESLSIDLHWGLFAPGLFNMPTEAVFRRAYRNHHLYDGLVACMSGMDIYAHLIGHFVKERFDHTAHQARMDLMRLPICESLEVNATTRHLIACGLYHAACYVLPWIAKPSRDDFAHCVLTQLRQQRGHFGLRYEWIRRYVDKHATTWVSRWLLPHALNTNIARTIASTLHHTWRMTRRNLTVRST